jgi:triosephosphate isomerase
MSNLPLVIANHKANKTWDEVATWIDEVAATAQNFAGTIIFCPSYPFLAAAYEKISQNGINIKLGSQDISCFDVGAYTGEVAASQIADIAKFAIIGHSERRQNFKESDKNLSEKVQNAQKAGIEPIFCVQDEKTQVPEKVSIVAYEPIFAIGTGNPDTPENAQSVAQKLTARLAARQAKSKYTIIYGGSVTGENVKSYVRNKIDGVLVGATNSLDPQKFIGIIKALE